MRLVIPGRVSDAQLPDWLLRSGTDRAPLETQCPVVVAVARAAPRPRLRIAHEECRIVLDVTAAAQFVRAVAHVGVPVVEVPELALATEYLVGFPRRVLL